MTLIFILMVQSHGVNQSSLNRDISIALTRDVGERVETSRRSLALKTKSFLNLCKLRILENLMHLNQFCELPLNAHFDEYAKTRHWMQYPKRSFISTEIIYQKHQDQFSVCFFRPNALRSRGFGYATSLRFKGGLKRKSKWLRCSNVLASCKTHI